MRNPVNGLTPPKAGVTDWPPGGATRAARGAPEPSEAFAGILDSHQARTATAEGHDKSPEVKGRGRRDDGPQASERAERRSNADWARERRAADGTERERPVKQQEGGESSPAETPRTDQAPADVVEVDPIAPDAPVVPPVVDSAAPAALAVVPVPVAEVQPAVAVAPAPPQPQVNVATASVAVVSQPVATNPEAVAVPGAAVAAAAAQADGVPTEAVVSAAKQVGQQADAKPAQPAQPAQPAERPAVPAQSNAPANQQQQQSDAGAKDPSAKHAQPGTLPAQAAEQARTVAQAYGRVAEHGRQPAEAPVAQPNGQPAVTATPVSNVQQPAGISGQSQATPVPLARAAETVEHVLRLAASRGVTHARIALNPAELGSIDVHLRHTAEGLVAKVVAHSAEAVVQLQQAANDLRRSLEEQGVNILNLDIGHSGEDRSAGRAGSGAGDEGHGRERGGDPVADGAAVDGEVTVKTNLQLPNGVLVDVLA
jgi:hypothetical protein